MGQETVQCARKNLYWRWRGEGALKEGELPLEWKRLTSRGLGKHVNQSSSEAGRRRGCRRQAEMMRRKAVRQVERRLTLIPEAPEDVSKSGHKKLVCSAVWPAS